jgi:predicted short-subunit dehydrogenase-like oxidoreductase (DUF2520 family)
MLDGILLIGTGRVAFHLGHAWLRAGLPLCGVVGRNTQHAKKLALELGTSPFSLQEQWPPADLLLIAVSDDAVATVAQSLPIGPYVVAHTSGAQGTNVLAPHAHTGVLWPLCSLSLGAPVDLARVPLVWEANGPEAAQVLTHVARSTSGKVVEMALEDRSLVHTAAVFASNFPVFLMREARRLVAAHGGDPDLLNALWSGMARRVEEVGPEQALTGPARRGDRRTVQIHLDRLADEPDLRRAYAVLSEMLLKAYHP